MLTFGKNGSPLNSYSLFFLRVPRFYYCQHNHIISLFLMGIKLVLFLFLILFENPFYYTLYISVYQCQKPLAFILFFSVFLLRIKHKTDVWFGIHRFIFNMFLELLLFQRLFYHGILKKFIKPHYMHLHPRKFINLLCNFYSVQIGNTGITFRVSGRI